MGTLIELNVGPIAVDYSKNSVGIHHGDLFVESDRKRLSKVERADAFVKPLHKLIPRLEILGSTLGAAKEAFNGTLPELAETYSSTPDLTFADFLDFLSRHPLDSLDDEYIDFEYTWGDPPDRFSDDPFVSQLGFKTNCYTEVSFFSQLLCAVLNHQPYLALRSLAAIPQNANALVVWEYGPLVKAGWADESDFELKVSRNSQILIATEGTSDIHVLKRAFSLFMPELSGFFRFIDVSERHPFSSASGLAGFAEGLVAIDALNQILFVFDNDAEGWESFEKVQGLKLPPNMRATTLPELEVLKTFNTFGPQGNSYCDINRRAAAIECYLDLRLPGRKDAQVVWSNYKKPRGVYQGSLEYKESYSKYFLDQPTEFITSGAYDSRNLRKVLDHLVEECIKLTGGTDLALARLPD